MGYLKVILGSRMSGVSGGCPGELRGAPEPRPIPKLFWDLECLECRGEDPVNFGELRSPLAIWKQFWDLECLMAANNQAPKAPNV